MTGFTADEERLGRMVAEAIRRGVPESTFGLGGKRTVGPMVTLQWDNGRPAYRTNDTPGVTLGSFPSQARDRVNAIYAEWHRAKA